MKKIKLPLISKDDVTRLKISKVSWENAVKTALGKKLPKEGWPQKEDLRKKKKK